jgi:energy-coupling factor transporter ATP-binding protein EcfA2
MNEFSISIPQEVVAAKINEIVSFKLRHDKLQQMIKTSVVEISLDNFTEIKKELKDILEEKLTSDLTVTRDSIIESFLESKRTDIHLNSVKIATVDDPTAHKELTKLIKFLSLYKQALIVGPTGSGKSTMASQAAKAMNLPFGSFSCNMEASKSELLGFANINGYIESTFLKFYENGGVFLVDEFDAMSPNISVVLNAAFDRSGQLGVPNRVEKPVAVKHPEFYCILAGNTFGSGSIDYSGREIQDKAFLDRFKMSRIVIDYDEQLEKQIAGSHYDWLNRVRGWMKKHVDNEEFSTRSFYDATVLLVNSFTKKDVLSLVSMHWDETLKDKIIADLK